MKLWQGKGTWKLLLILGLFILGMALAACGGDDGTQAVVKAKRLEIVDDAGFTRMVLTTVDGKRPSLTLADEKGNFRAWLFLSENGAPNLVLVDSPRFALLDEAGEVRSAQRLDGAGAPIFTQLDSAGRVRSILQLSQEGTPSIELYDTSGRPIWIAPQAASP